MLLPVANNGESSLVPFANNAMLSVYNVHLLKAYAQNVALLPFLFGLQITV